jgi:hypothetical protein
MAITFKLPVINADSALILNTPIAATDVVLASGLLSIKDESGATALKIKACDLLGFRYAANAAGTANVVDAALAAVTMVNNGSYVLTVYAPNVQNFFGGGKETGATYQTRTYEVGVDGSATTAELATLFAARINADVNAYFTAVVTGGTTVRITADNAGFGALIVKAPAASVITDFTAWVSPAGTPAQVLNQVQLATYVTAAGYQTYQIIYRKNIKHNIVNGLEVVKPVTALVYLNTADANTAATVAKLTSILDGSYATTFPTAAAYLGCPAV